MDGRVPARLSRAEARRFGLLVGGAFLVLAAVSWWRGHEVPVALFGAVGGLLVLGGLLLPDLLGPVHAAWMGLSRVLSKVTTPIVMAVLYFVVFMPVGLVMRAFGRNALVRPDGESYWVARPDGARRSDLTRPF